MLPQCLNIVLTMSLKSLDNALTVANLLTLLQILETKQNCHKAVLIFICESYETKRT